MYHRLCFVLNEDFFLPECAFYEKNTNLMKECRLHIHWYLSLNNTMSSARRCDRLSSHRLSRMHPLRKNMIHLILQRVYMHVSVLRRREDWKSHNKRYIPKAESDVKRPKRRNKPETNEIWRAGWRHIEIGHTSNVLRNDGGGCCKVSGGLIKSLRQKCIENSSLSSRIKATIIRNIAASTEFARVLKRKFLKVSRTRFKCTMYDTPRSTNAKRIQDRVNSIRVAWSLLTKSFCTTPNIITAKASWNISSSSFSSSSSYSPSWCVRLHSRCLRVGYAVTDFNFLSFYVQTTVRLNFEFFQRFNVNGFKASFQVVELW